METTGGVDTAIEAAGRPDVMARLLDSVRPGGRAVVVGLPAADATVQISPFHLLNEKTLTGLIYGSLDPVHLVADIAEGTQAAGAGRPAGVVGDVDHHCFEGFAFDAEVPGSTDVEVQLRFATECGEYGTGDQRPLLESELVALPDIAEQVSHCVPHHLAREGPGSWCTCEQTGGELAAGVEPLLRRGRMVGCRHSRNVTNWLIRVIAGVGRFLGYVRGMALIGAEPRTDEIILDAAEDCFATAGVRGTTVEDIAAAAGVSRITVYRRIGNRDQIVLSVLLRIVDRYLVRLRPRLLAQPTLADAIVVLIRSTVRAARRDDLGLLFASEELGATGTPIPGAMAPLAERFGDLIAASSEQLEGRLGPGVSAIDAGEWVLRVIVSLATTEPARPRTQAETDDWVSRMVVPGIVTDEPSPSDTNY